MQQTQRWATRVELATAISDYIDRFHNTRRRHSALGMLTPTEYEQHHRTTTPNRRGPFGPVDPAQPASLGALAGVETTTSNQKTAA